MVRVGLILSMLFGVLFVGAPESRADTTPGISATPSVGLTEGESVTVDARGMPVGQGQFVLDLCTASSTDPITDALHQCDSLDPFGMATAINSDGTSEVTADISEVDCDTPNTNFRYCQFVGFLEPTAGTNNVVEASTPITFAPPSFTYQAASNLIDGQTAELEVAGFERETTVSIDQDGDGSGVLDGSFTTNTTGGGTYRFTVHHVGPTAGTLVVGGDVPTLGNYDVSQPFVPVAADNLPRAPKITSKSVTPHTVRLSWTPPKNGGQPIAGYVITRSGYDTRGNGDLTESLPASTKSVTFTHLFPVTVYGFTVAAVNYDQDDGAVTKGATQTAAIRQRVTISVNKRTVAAGHVLVVSGAVKPIHAGKVKVESYRRGNWTAKTITEGRGGRYRAALHLTKGTTKVRVVAEGAKTYTSATSRVISVSVT